MKSGQFLLKKSIWLIMHVMAVCLLLVITSCKGKKANSVPACVKLTKKQIQGWIDKGYTDPAGKNYISSVQFHTAYASPGKIFRVFAIGRAKDGSLIKESLEELTPVDSCNKTHIKLNAYISVGIVEATLDQLGIITNGKVTDSLTYLRMEPFTFRDTASKFDLIGYEEYRHKKDGMIKNSTTGGYERYFPPCPPCPNCKPPCPDLCPDGCGALLVDSTVKKPQK